MAFLRQRQLGKRLSPYHTDDLKIIDQDLLEERLIQEAPLFVVGCSQRSPGLSRRASTDSR
jgi:hypothetical protein